MEINRLFSIVVFIDLSIMLVFLCTITKMLVIRASESKGTFKCAFSKRLLRPLGFRVMSMVQF